MDGIDKLIGGQMDEWMIMADVDLDIWIIIIHLLSSCSKEVLSYSMALQD